MLAPPVGRESFAQHQVVARRMFLFGSVLGGLAFGGLLTVGREAILMLGGPSLATALVIALLVLVIASLACDKKIEVPFARRQVSLGVLTSQSWPVTGLVWGIELGFGYRTFSVTPALHLVAGLALLTDRGWQAMAIGVHYSVARAMAILSVGNRSIAQEDQGVQLLVRLRTIGTWLTVAIVVACVSIALPT